MSGAKHDVVQMKVGKPDSREDYDRIQAVRMVIRVGSQEHSIIGCRI
ncbi:hypothetical protein [Paenibacillus mendelii]|uniref:PD(D/E)XK endonuclease domain-containing protein n=1 Tax=Paenibacillus mendelii TaxID=206163 RepID=A0ABV6J6E5_9BACL|nr:hypothetical protein [Paenibacillus mendelii]MCQ6559939.1 hypothetical protein [Paenibacillus mendelii]